MRVIALEEHFLFHDLVERIPLAVRVARGFPATPAPGPDKLLADLGAARIEDMDRNGIDVQILSCFGPGPDLLKGAEAIALARETNDRLAEAVAKHPDRFGGFAHLPMQDADAAADELRRCVRDLGFCGAIVNGTTQDRFLDDPQFSPVLAAAEELDVPIYLHPHLPPESVRKAYFEGLPGAASFQLSGPGWGWHSETALHILRMVLSGTFDRHPKLKMIVGHMGEGLPAMLMRCDQVFGPHAGHLTRSVSRTVLDQVSITTSGLFTQPPFEIALAVFGVDRVLFSVDYPYAPNHKGREFLDALKLPASDFEKISHGNAERLLKLKKANQP
jgi:predicted TIM-barrel fold metal-dependent hydrolase